MVTHPQRYCLGPDRGWSDLAEARSSPPVADHQHLGAFGGWRVGWWRDLQVELLKRDYNECRIITIYYNYTTIRDLKYWRNLQVEFLGRFLFKKPFRIVHPPGNDKPNQNIPASRTVFLLWGDKCAGLRRHTLSRWLTHIPGPSVCWEHEKLRLQRCELVERQAFVSFACDLLRSSCTLWILYIFQFSSSSQAGMSLATRSLSCGWPKTHPTSGTGCCV